MSIKRIHRHFSTYLAMATWGVACFVAAPIHLVGFITMLVVVPLMLAITVFIARFEARRDLRDTR